MYILENNLFQFSKPARRDSFSLFSVNNSSGIISRVYYFAIGDSILASGGLTGSGDFSTFTGDGNFIFILPPSNNFF